MAVSPTDANNYVGPGALAGQGGATFPKWLYHTTKAPVIVQNWAQETALITADSSWSETPGNLNVNVANNIDVPWVNFMINTLASQSYANDAAAAVGGVSIGFPYRNGSVVQVRVS